MHGQWKVHSVHYGVLFLMKCAQRSALCARGVRAIFEHQYFTRILQFFYRYIRFFYMYTRVFYRYERGFRINIRVFYTVSTAFAARKFSLLYKRLFPPISGKTFLSLLAGEFYPLYQVTHSTFTYHIEGNQPRLFLTVYRYIPIFYRNSKGWGIH